MSTKSKVETTSTKMADLFRNLDNTSEEAQLNSHVKQAHINTQQEILDLQGKIHEQEDKIREALFAGRFSASVLYAARADKELMERKLEKIQEMLIELF